MIPKYRAWDTHRNKMYLPEELARDGLTLSADGRGFVNVSGRDTRLDEYYTHLVPLQSIGLPDKNDTEIFDGDIIKYRSFRCMSSSCTGNCIKESTEDIACENKDIVICVSKVYYEHGSWVGGQSPGWKNVKVIGNIHTHLYLLQIAVTCEGCGMQIVVGRNEKLRDLVSANWEIFDDGELCFCPKCRLNKTSTQEN